MKAIARLGLLLLAASAALHAQAPPLTLPQPSPQASLTQTVGLTQIDIRYHRPAVNKRTIWGDLVPWGQVWRAGANQARGGTRHEHLRLRASRREEGG
jgi:hypothetical protein